MTENNGQPLVGNHVIRFRLYDAEQGGAQLWEESHTLTLGSRDNGIFSIILGSLTPFKAEVFTKPLWLGLEVDTDGEMTPRLRLTAAGYAISANTLDGIGGDQFLRADIDAAAQGTLTLTRSGKALIIHPAKAVAPNTPLVQVQDAAGAPRFTIDGDGDVTIAGDLTVHGALNGGLAGSAISIDSGDGLVGGPITGTGTLRVGAGDGVAVGADAVSIKLSPGAGLSADGTGVSLLRTCANGQLLKWQAGTSAWTCAADASGAGAIGEVIAGAGLTGGGSSGSVTVDIGTGTGLLVTPDALAVDVGTTAGKVLQLDNAGALPAVSGAALTALNASALSAGTVPDARLSADVSRLGPTIESSEVTDGTLTADDTAAAFLTAGSGVAVTKSGPSWQIAVAAGGGTIGDITGVAAGTGLTGGGTSGDVTLAVDVGTAAGKIVQLDSAGALPAVSGAALTTLNASALSAGTVPDARLSANVSLLGNSIDSAEITDGTISQADLAVDSVGPAALRSDAIQPGDIQLNDLPAHASLHQPGGVDALPTGLAVSVGSANAAGASTSFARADHVHQGVHSLNASGQLALVGDVTLAPGNNMALTQSGQTITINAQDTSRVSTQSAVSTTIGTSSDTALLAATITKTQAASALFITATVQLHHNTANNSKLIDVKLFRDAVQLDASYQAQIGTGSGQVRELPVTLHAWDTSPAGTYTIRLKARSSAAGATAEVRRLTVIEFP